MSGGVLGYECNGDGHYNQSRYVYCYLGGRVGVHFGAKGTYEFSKVVLSRVLLMAYSSILLEYVLDSTYS